MRERFASTLGKHARAARLRAGLSQSQVAEALGLSPLVYGRIERGKLLPTLPTLCRLAAVLQVSLDALTGGSPQEKPPRGGVLH